jgi:glycosyltransferase involved in cell wall biosynthesis
MSTLNLPKVEIAVITSVYNGEIYISDYVDSLCRQTLKSFTLYIIDDGSIDHSYIFLSENLRKSGLCYKLFRNKMNKGLTNSLIFLLEQVKENYVTRLDIDDRWYPNFLAFQFKFLKNHPNIILSCTNMELFSFNNGDNLEHDQRCVKPFNTGLCSGFVHLNDLLIRNFIIHSTVFFRRFDVIELGGYSYNYTYAQDYELWLRLLINNRKLFYHDIVFGVRIADDLCIGNKKSVEQRLSVLKIKLLKFKYLFKNYRTYYSILRDFISVMLAFFRKLYE